MHACRARSDCSRGREATAKGLALKIGGRGACPTCVSPARPGLAID